MYILHVDEQLGWRGGEQQASWLIQGLVRRGHRVAIAARPESAFLTSSHGGADFKRVPLPLRNELDLPSAWRLAKTVREDGVDILHAHSSHAHTHACLARAMAGRGRVVVSRRVSFPPKSHPLNRWKYGLPDRFISVSNKVDEVLAEFGIDASRRTVVHSAVDPARLNVEPIPRTELHVPDNVPLLVSAGALVGHKDHATLVAAMPRVLREYPDVRLIIAGEGPLRADIERQIQSLNLAPNITLLGHRQDAPRLIRAADLYVSSSWSEGLGTSVLEALACRTPVVATAAGGVGEMVHNGQTGLLVPNRDSAALAAAIVASLQDRLSAETMARNGRRLIDEEFVVDRMVEGTIRVYEQLLNGEPKS